MSGPIGGRAGNFSDGDSVPSEVSDEGVESQAATMTAAMVTHRDVRRDDQEAEDMIHLARGDTGQCPPQPEAVT
jgi:hypothetical protein